MTNLMNFDYSMQQVSLDSQMVDCLGSEDRGEDVVSVLTQVTMVRLFSQRKVEKMGLEVVVSADLVG